MSIPRTTFILLCPLAFFLMYDFIQMDFMNSLAAYLHQMISVSNTALGFIASAYFWINLCGLLVAGFLLDRYSPKWLMIISLALSLCGLSLFILTPSVMTLIFWRSMAGLAGSFSYLSVVKLLATHFSKNKIGLILGFSGFSIMLAGMIAQTPLLMTLFYVGVIDTLCLDLLAGAVVMGLCYWLIPGEYPKTNQVVQLDLAKRVNAYTSGTNWLLSLSAALVNLPLFVLGALWGNLYLTHSHLLTAQQASVIIALIFLGDMIGAPIMGGLSDCVSSRSKVMLYAIILLIVVMLSIYCLPLATSPWVLGILFFFLGFLITLQTPIYAAVIDKNPAHNVSKATSMVCFLSVLAGAVSQPLFGWLVNQATCPILGYHHGFLMMLLANLLSLCLISGYHVLGKKREQIT